MDKYVFLYWVGNEYKLIKILRDIIYRHSDNGNNFKVILLTPQNIKGYIEDIPDITKLIPAHQADVARVFAIEKYGGIWLDSDTLVMDNLQRLFDIFKTKDGFFIKENNQYICNGVFGSRKNTPLMKRWKEIIINSLKDIDSLEWTTLGSSILKTLYSENYFKKYIIFNGLDNMYPINWDKIPDIFLDEPISSYKKLIREFQPLIILVNTVYKKCEKLSIENILNMHNPLGYLLRSSLPKINMFIADSENFGDAISHIFYSKLSFNFVNKVNLDFTNDSYLTTGSHLRLCKSNHIVMGSGFISENDDLGKGDWDNYTNKVYTKPKQILFVRGPLTRNKLLNMGIDCPEKYGDPLLIFPLIQWPSKNPTYKIGLIPHYIDKNNINFIKFKNKLDKSHSVKVINILTGTNYESFIDDICSCEYIITSSLHGVILGIAYKRKTIFTEFSDKVIGNRFKFNDFLASLGVSYSYPSYNDENILSYTINVKNNNLIDIGTTIIRECPFITLQRKDFLIKLWNDYVKTYSF